jgi:hypothetical protein
MKMEADAKEAKLGLWKDPNPIPPWEFRHGVGQRTFDTDPSPTLFNQDLAIRGNKRSRKYHRADCPNYDDIAHHNRIPFDSAKEAEDAGYTLAGNCPH